MKGTKLKACNCGGEAKFVLARHTLGGIDTVMCTKCSHRTVGENAVKDWNTINSQSVAEIEKIIDSVIGIRLGWNMELKAWVVIGELKELAEAICKGGER